ncbi:MAG: CDP-diacylglycerol--serine O-phosphatidyltransferase [Candidatus Midichloria sp.]|nr:MAG: CDP-diacylglycerol--serine O-phosphatidyltransferase [Candidatus Midichloria sp.]
MAIQKNKINTIPLVTLIPSIITMFALCLGTTAIRCALEAKFDIAAALIIVASIMDGLDGKVARLLNSTSHFGAHLDSLADLVSFGVAPGMVLYLWSLHQLTYKGVGWAVVLFYITCSAFRLARFNVQAGNLAEKKSNNFFTGVPTPAAAGLVLLPLVITFNITECRLPNTVIAVYVALIGMMMISQLPTFSGRKISVKREYVVPLLVLTGVIMAGILIEPWFILPLMGIGYILSIPISAIYYYRFYYNKKSTSEK